MIMEKTINIKSEVYEKRATIYTDKTVKQKAVLMYFHGGGLLFGRRDDLPEAHKKTFCDAGYTIIAFDYPLAPAVKLDKILEDCIDSVEYFLKNRDEFIDSDVPYFLFGRSAGAYLALLIGRNNFSEMPRGLLSYYGYGLLCDQWYKTPSEYYLELLPRVSETVLDAIPKQPHSIGDFETHYATYAYARQSGKWPQMFFDGKEKHLLADYSLRLVDKYPCKLFCAHSSNDTDVPFDEFKALCDKYNVRDKVLVSDKMHDFDRVEESASTAQLLTKSVEFIEKLL